MNMWRWSDLFPGCMVRWEDNRPFEVEVVPGLARDPATHKRIVFHLARQGWKVKIAQFGRCLSNRAGAHAYAMVLESEPAPVTS